MEGLTCIGAGVLSWQTGTISPHFHWCPEENNFMAYIQYLLMVWWSLIEEEFLFAFSPYFLLLFLLGHGFIGSSCLELVLFWLFKMH